MDTLFGQSHEGGWPLTMDVLHSFTDELKQLLFNVSLFLRSDRREVMHWWTAGWQRYYGLDRINILYAFPRLHVHVHSWRAYDIMRSMNGDPDTAINAGGPSHKIVSMNVQENYYAWSPLLIIKSFVSN